MPRAGGRSYAGEPQPGSPSPDASVGRSRSRNAWFAGGHPGRRPGVHAQRPGHQPGRAGVDRGGVPRSPERRCRTVGGLGAHGVRGRPDLVTVRRRRGHRPPRRGADGGRGKSPRDVRGGLVQPVVADVTTGVPGGRARGGAHRRGTVPARCRGRDPTGGFPRPATWPGSPSSRRFPPVRDGAVDLSVAQALLRTTSSIAGGIDDEPVRLTGFVVHDDRVPDGYLLTRFAIGCCVAVAPMGWPS